MTKEEYLSIVNKEIDRFDKEKQDLVRQISVLEKMGDADKEINEKKNRLEIIQGKLSKLSTLVGVESKIRIEAMSDIEIMEHKREQVISARENISREEKVLETIRQNTQKQQEELDKIIQSGDTSENNIHLAKATREKLWLFQRDLEKQKEEIAKLRKELQELEDKSIEDYKKDLLKKANNNTNVDDIIRYSENIGLAHLDNDPKKAQELAGLYRQYLYLKAKHQKTTIDKRYFLTKLPRPIADAIRTEFNQKNESTSYIVINDPRPLLKLLEKADKYFRDNVIQFTRFCDVDRVNHLVGKDALLGIDPYKVDFDKLEKYIGIIEESEIEEIRELVKSRDELNKQWIKTRNTKKAIEDYDNEIYRKLYSLYSKIINWYRTFSLGYFQNSGEYYGHYDMPILSFHLGDEASNTIALRDTNSAIANDKKALADIKEDAEKHLKEVAEYEEKAKLEIDAIVEKIKAITGKKDVSVYDIKNQEQQINNQIALGYEGELLKQIREEAQRQAEERRKELEELYKMREQAEQDDSLGRGK